MKRPAAGTLDANEHNGMHIHILGICGTFMGSLALIAREAGHHVTGSDANVYPPMSDMLRDQGIELMEGYAPEHLEPAPDCVIVGNAMSRGNPAVEYMLDRGLDYRSGPQWLAENVLHDRWVLAVSGTHGKTTTASLLAWLLEDAGLRPGFLIGGLPGNFAASARLGQDPFFVIEADEYDSAFFDKRSKFVHFRPRTLIVNNIEFDHADIFPDLQAIQRQFHHLIRTVPGNGLIVVNGDQQTVTDTLAMGCWTPVQTFGRGSEAQWRFKPGRAGQGSFTVTGPGEQSLDVHSPLAGEHNAANALAALLAARHVGVPLHQGADSLLRFTGVKRRMELRGEVAGVRVYDDFAHHPTAIALTLTAARGQMSGGRLIAVLEPRSNTMKLGAHRAALPDSLREADRVALYQPPNIGWPVKEISDSLGDNAATFDDLNALIAALVDDARPGDTILIMSNGGFGGIHDKLLAALTERHGAENQA